LSDSASVPLALIGLGCLFPGSTGRKRFWANIVDGVDAIRPVPETHWRVADYLDPDPKAPDKVYSARGGFLDPVPFAPAEFGIAPNNLEATDSSQLLGLIAAQQALEDCGYAVHETAGKKLIDRNRVSVILGVTGTLQLVIPLGARLGHPLWRKALREAGVDDATAEDVVQRIADGYVPWQENSFPGLLGNVVAGRIANRLDLGGTNCVVDAACASSLGAIHLASLELATRRADLVLTGGVDCFNDIFMFTCFSKTPALSPTGQARPFDAQGDGTVLGEGLGLVVLKRLDDARRDGDRIYAVLKGIGSSSDGKGGAIYAPRREGQMVALRNAYQIADVSPATVELVEAHGTGTKVGDATELSALVEVYRQSGRPGTWCAVGSIKSQIGHTKAAAGAAGLIKAALALYHKVLPPTIKITQPLDELREGPFYANTQRRPWMPSPEHPRRAALSAFGFGGSNFHCVLEEADPAKPEIDWCGDVELLAFSGNSETELQQQLRSQAEPATTRRLFRPDAPLRVLIACNKADVTAKLQQARALREGEGVFVGRGPAGKLGILFPGQGSQYVGMLREWVCHFPAAFDTFVRADAAYRDATGRRLVDVVYPIPAFEEASRSAQEETLRATEVAQPALGAVQLAAWRVLQTFGLRGHAFAGHSFGELVALCAAGRLAESDLFRLALERGRLMAQAALQSEPGGMLAVKASEQTLLALLAEQPLELTLANKNAPQQTVLSGSQPALRRVRELLAARQIACTPLPVAAAFHSPFVAAAQEPFAALLRTVRFHPGAAVYANATAQPYPDAGQMLLAEQLARPVEWVGLLRAMQADGITDFLEVGAAAKLTPLVQATLSATTHPFACYASDHKAGMLDVARTLAWLAARGYAVDLAAWHPSEPAPAKKPGLTVPISGINYVKPRPPRPARSAPKPTTPELLAPPPPVAAPSGVSANAAASRPTTPTGSLPVSPVNGTAKPTMTSPTSSPHSQAPPSVSVEGSALAQAFALTRETLQFLQRMQEQQAALHRQFLEGQEAAQRTLAALIEQQQRLLSAGSVPSPPPVAPAALAWAAQPASAGAMTPMAPPAPPTPVAPSHAGAPTLAVQPPPPLAHTLVPSSSAPVSSASVTVAAPTPGAVQAAASVVPDVAAPIAPAPPARNQVTSQATNILLEIIAEKTGYARGDLDLSMSLDADLGIDSIKRVEILSALQERLPEAPPVKPEQLGSLHTLGDIAAFLAGPAEVARAHPNEAAQPLTPSAVSAGSPSVPLMPSVVSAAGSPSVLLRGVVRPVPLTGPRSRRRLAGRLQGIGEVSGLTLPSQGPLAGLVIVAPKQTGADFLREALFAVQAAGPQLRAHRGVLLTVTCLDGAFGLAGGSVSEPLAGALAGLAKTAAHEWPEVTCRALDLAPSVPLRVLTQEWELAGPVEVGYTARGCVTLEYEHVPLAPGEFVPFRPGDLVVVSGGARGVTAEAALALARRFRPTLLLLGRSPEPTPEPDWLAALPDEAALKRELPRRLNLPLRQVGEQVRTILAARDMRQYCERMRQTGARAIYRCVDVRDAAAVAACLAQARREFGPVRGLLHGAGVLADALIADKKPEQFQAVWSTKIDGVQALLQATAEDDLRAVVFFSSSTARFGRTGQVDYAMANEALNKIAARVAAERPGCRVVSLNWGPWAGGMVTPGLAKLFASEGVGLIPLHQGAELLATELTHGPAGPREIVVLANSTPPPETPPPPPTPPVAFERLLTLADHPFLADHVLDGKAVLPFALMLEWLAHAAVVANPGLIFHGADDLRLLKGVILDASDVTLRFAAGKASKQGGLFVVPTELRSQRGGKEIVHARGQILLTTTLPPPPDPLRLPPQSGYPHAPYDGGRLFHGPRFQALQRVEGVGAAGVLAQLAASAPPADWMRRPLRTSWITEPLALDTAFQAMILWTQQQHGQPSLPTFLQRYRQYRRAFPSTGGRLVLLARGGGRADFDLCDENNQVIARAEGYECVMDASLQRAFENNRLAESVR